MTLNLFYLGNEILMPHPKFGKGHITQYKGKIEKSVRLHNERDRANRKKNCDRYNDECFCFLKERKKRWRAVGKRKRREAERRRERLYAMMSIG